MQVSNSQMMAELRATMTDITKQIEAVKESTQKQIDALPYPDAVTVYQITDRHGHPVLTDLLCARAELLAAMVRLQTAK